MPTTEEVLLLVASIPEMDIQPYIDKVSDAPLVADVPAPGEIIKESKNKKVRPVKK